MPFTPEGFASTRFRRFLAIASVSLLALPARASGQQCVGLPHSLSVNAAYVVNTPSHAATSSLGFGAPLGGSPLFVVAEGGRIDAHATLLPNAGYYASALLGVSAGAQGPWHACLAIARAEGNAPSASGATANSLDATSGLIGAGLDLAGRGDAATAVLFADWQRARFDAGGNGGLIRAGVLVNPFAHWFARATYDVGTESPRATAIGIAIGVRW